MSAHVDTFVRDNLPPQDQWPELKFTLPELQFPALFNASSILDRAIANNHGARNAVLYSSDAISYGLLLEEANRIAHVLAQAFGLKPGNRVLIHSSNTRLSMAVWWAVWRAGGVAVGTMPMLRAHELAVILNKAQISHAIVDTQRAGELEQAQRDAPVLKHILTTDDIGERMTSAPSEYALVATAADDPALIAFTSGTTGTPKGCVHLHRDIAAMAETFSRHVLRPKSTDVFIGTPPLAFTFGLGAGVIFPANVGAATAICPKPGFDVLADTIEQHRATTLFTSPTGYRALMKQDLSKLGSLHTCVSAGEHLPRATSDQWFERTGIRIIDGIGSTEMIHIFVSARGNDIRPGATGKAVPGYEATLLDENDQPIEGEGEGRLAIKGPTGCRYLADDRQRNYVINGWNVTGDVYQRDSEGYFRYIARADDMIISSGYNIGAPEVENALLTHDAVAECAVVGVPDEERGQIVKAFVVLKEGAHATGRTLQDHVKETIAPYKYPRAVEFVAELPKTYTGKVQRFKLRSPS
ncbi:AMP-binding protein [Candidatus Viadribacter manganicus]|uniref:2-aminobenzoate-CoA ligase n=1 Tax=Candidatus Viadribacter manganicus TaxID=1759059 RepID=A0A1B1AHL0_9PROT|nr:AMP-binding protein [Candidatus Viadribacter manganicus]ANP46038.1 2-aminobenzoate-CoA ligase [Candidatus Viadribacter manganicus]